MTSKNLHEYHSKTPRASGKVLLMDDDRFFSLIATGMLHDIGYTVTVARDGEEAVSIYRKEMDAGSRFDVVILDVFVKRGLGAGETLTKLRDIDPGVKAVVSSGSHDAPLMNRYREFGFEAVLPKPYSPQDVWQAVSAAIERG